MTRATVVLRAAVPQDAEALRELWIEMLRPTSGAEQLADVVAVIEEADADPDARVVVAEVDGRVVGAVHLRCAPITALNLDRMVRAFAPHVSPDHQRRGVGSALMESAVTFAEERGIPYVGAAALSSSRDANRFFARLAMGPRAVLRVASTHGLRQRLSASRPSRGAGATSSRHIDKVLAVRRGRRGARVSP